MRTGVILAAGFGSRLAQVSDKALKPLTKVGGIPLIQRAVRGLELAGCMKVVIVVGHGKADVMAAAEGYAGKAEIVFAENPRFDLKNGVSVLAARPFIDDVFVLAMADHVMGDEVMAIAAAHHPAPGTAALLVDRKLDTIFDMDDATKVLSKPGAEPGTLLIDRIGKTIPEYDLVDCGVFVCTPALMDAIAQVYDATGDASLSDGVQALALTDRMFLVDIGDGFWQDVDTPEMLEHAERELTRRSGSRDVTRTDDVRIEALRPLIPAAILHEEIPLGEHQARVVEGARRAVTEVIQGRDDRLVVVCGPCSIHDVAAATDYAARLAEVASRLAGDLVIVMRVYFEKPRTTVGWKGLINDPLLDGSFRINQGLRTARQLLADLATMGVPAGCEFLDVITPQYLADLVAWGAIGARTTESQVHRELASGLSCPVGFKNGTDGNIDVAADAVLAASHPHTFLSVTKQGLAAIVLTRGNDACHVILRGGKRGPNYDRAQVADIVANLDKRGLAPRLMVDCSHGNSEKDHNRQPVVARDIAQRVAAGQRDVFGVMLESHLVGGRQDQRPGQPLTDQPLTYGQSITDACLAWDDTVPVLDELAAAVRARRAL